MKSAIFKEKGKVDVEERQIPKISEQTDAIVRVVRACVCGSDLWPFRGLSPHKEGPIGHEFIGVVHEAGSDVTGIQKGDLVIAPFTFSDGTCPHCQAGFQTACVNGGVFGNGSEGSGGQAEYVRVPLAEGTLVKVPGSEFSDDVLASLLTLSDVMGTGYHAAISANVKEGDTVAVVGDGAVGLCGVLSAKLLGAKRIIVLGSTHENRQKLAQEFGGTDIIEKRGEDAVAEVMKITDNVGADAVLECVGTSQANDTAFAIARPGAIVGRVGLPHEVVIDPLGTFFRNIGMRGGPAPAREYLPKLLDMVLKGEINPGKVFDKTYSLDEIQKAYEDMDQRETIKSLLKISEP